jgi:hypothetical protein
MHTLLNLSESEMKLLKNNNVSIDYINDEKKISISDSDGNKAIGFYLCKIVVDDLIKEFLEESLCQLSKEEICLNNDYEIICLSPFEIISPEGYLAKGKFANIIIEEIRYKL